MWKRITSGKDPLTEEGIVAWPVKGGRPLKVKQTPEYNTFVQSIFPAKGRLRGMAGGFEYSRSPEGKPVGRVGTGFSDEVRRQMLEEQEDWIGRVARVRAQQAFPSGALRAPVFIGLSEDR
jgi:ATP-dependent DNA ligase